MEPAQTIVKKLGGPTKVAKIVGVHRTRVSNWQRPREKGGANGRVPQDHIPKLLAFAQINGVDLCADDFLLRENS